MPLYEYQCEKCGHRFEKIQKFSDKMVKKCPECGGKVEQMISAPAVQFKGRAGTSRITPISHTRHPPRAAKIRRRKRNPKSDGSSKESSSKESSSKESSSKDSSAKDSSSSGKDSSSKESSKKTAQEQET